MFKNVRDKTQIFSLARKVYLEKVSSFLETYLEVCKHPHTYLFSDLTQSMKDILGFRTKNFPGETTEVFAPVQGNEPVEVTATLPSRP